MALSTAAAVISYISRIENETAEFYETVCRTHSDLRSMVEAFSNENRKFETRVKRAYYSVVSDALETGFSFQGVSEDVVVPRIDPSAGPADILKMSHDLETRIQELYESASASSKVLLPDVSRAMAQVVRSREKRRASIVAHINAFGTGRK